MISAKQPLGRRIDTNGRDTLGQLAGPGGRRRARRFAGPGPGCGLGAACAREASRAEPVQRVLGRAGLKNEKKNKKNFLLFSRNNFKYIF